MQLWPVDQSGCMCIWSVSAAWLHLPWATASLHIILAIFTAAGLTKLSPAVRGAFALAFFQETVKAARTALLWEYVFTPEVDGR